MKQSSPYQTWLFCALCTALCLLVACESDDGYVPELVADSGVSVDVPQVTDVATDAVGTHVDALGVDNDAANTDGPSLASDGRVSDAAGDTAPLPGACNIYDPQSCPSANMKCDLAHDLVSDVRYTACRASGAGKVGDSCSGGSQCGRGLVCINTAGIATCRQVCNPIDGVPKCTAPGETCAGRSATYGVTFCL